jgi:hypothetical protein
VNEAVLADLGLRAEDLSFLRAKVRRPSAIELDTCAESRELNLVQPSRLHVDVESKRNG